MSAPTGRGGGATETVSVRRPAAYLAIAAVLALGSLLLPTGDEPDSARAEGEPTEVTAPRQQACTGVRASLRPTGALPAPGAMPAGSAMAAIAARGRLVVGVDQGKYLMGFRDPQTGELQGSDIDLARRIATAIFGDPRRIQFVVLDIADRAAAIERRDVDLVINSFAITCARQRTVEFSAPYMSVTQRLLVPVGRGVREVEDLAGGRVCTSRGSTTEAVLGRLPVQTVVLPGIPDCVVEMQRGRVDAISSDDVLLAGLAAQDRQTEVVGRALDRTTYGIGVSPSRPDLVRFVNGVLERARADGSLAAEDRRWYAGFLNPVPTPPAAAYRD